jgi:hypothetical protein
VYGANNSIIYGKQPEQAKDGHDRMAKNFYQKIRHNIASTAISLQAKNYF